MKMSKEQYIKSIRTHAVEVARNMLNGSANYLEGAIELSGLASEIGLAENDEDFDAFRVVASEVDHLPIGEPRLLWSKEALERYEPEIIKSIEWAKKYTLLNCHSIVDRFHHE